MTEEFRQKDMPLISVIVPVYNVKEYLPRCVRSITQQTYRNLEILLIDDGSTDGTRDIADALAAEDQRIRVFHKQNGGSSSARNYGIQKAQGSYLGFVDSDDYIGEEMYTRLMAAVLENQVRITQVGRREVGEDQRPLPDICIPPSSTEVIESGEFLKELLLHKGDCSFCTKLVHKDLFTGEGFPEGVLNEDFHLLVKLLMGGERIVSLPWQEYHVYYRSDSNTRRPDRNNFSRVYADNVDNADMVLELVKIHYPQLQEVAVRFGIYQRLDYMLHIPEAQMNSANSQYREVVRWLRRYWLPGIRNPYLNKKNKIYHTLFVLFPKASRVIHRKWKGGGHENG